MIRSAAGPASRQQKDADTYASRFAHTDVLRRRRQPWQASLRTRRRPGGRVGDAGRRAFGSRRHAAVRADRRIDGKAGRDWLAATVAELGSLPNVSVATRTTAIGYYHQNLVGLCQRLTDHLDTVPETGAPRERMGRSAPGGAGAGRARAPLVSTATTAPV